MPWFEKKQWEKLLVNNREQLKESHSTPIISHPTPICSSETNQLPLLSLSCQRIALPTCRHHGTIRHEGSRVSMAPTWGARNTRAPISTPLGVLRIQFRKACTIGYWWLAEKSTCGCCRPVFVFLCNGWSSEGCGVLFMQTLNVLASMLAVWIYNFTKKDCDLKAPSRFCLPRVISCLFNCSNVLLLLSHAVREHEVIRRFTSSISYCWTRACTTRVPQAR